MAAQSIGGVEKSATAIIGSEETQLSFSGCAFLCIYHVGVCAAIKEYAPQLMQCRMKGASAGAIAAAGLICNVCMSHATSTILQTVTEARAGSLLALSPNFDILGIVRKGLEQALPENAHILCTGRLFISATRARDYQNVLISEFASREELIQAILCSCFIPFYCGLTPPFYRGEQYIDGALSDNQPGKWERGMITISPFSGESDICPSDEDSASMFGFDVTGTSVQFTTQNLYRSIIILFPPAPEVCSRICRQGFEDALRFLTKNHLVPCVKCLTIQSSAIALPPLSQAKSAPLLANGQIFSSRAWALRRNVRRNGVGCEKCFEPFQRFEPLHFANVPLPSVVQKTLAEMEAKNAASWLSWLRRWRLIRWWLRLVLPPMLLPIELLQFFLRKTRARIRKSVLAPTEAYLLRFQQLVDFILHEVSNCRRSPSAVLPVGSPSLLGIVDSGISSNSNISTQQQIQQNSIVEMAHRKVSFVGQRKASISIAPLDLAVSSEQVKALEFEEKREEDEREEEEEEERGDKERRLLQQLLRDREDAILAFHYRDAETNELKICQIFDADGRHPREHCHSGTLCTTLAGAPEAWGERGGEDSGLSLAEEEEEQQQQKNIGWSDRSSFRSVPARQTPSKKSCSSSSTAGNPFMNARRHTFSSRPAARPVVGSNFSSLAQRAAFAASTSQSTSPGSAIGEKSSSAPKMRRRKVSAQQTAAAAVGSSNRQTNFSSSSEEEEEGRAKRMEERRAKARAN